MTNGNDEAFGHVAIGPDGSNGHWPGLTKKEYFAGLALQGILSGVVGKNLARDDDRFDMTKHTGLLAVQYADALIEALNQEAK